jgi:hypothetical protein
LTILEKILFGFNSYCPLYSSLLSLKNPNCSNTLNTIIFYYINFKNINILTEVFNQLNVLESIHIVYCNYLDSKFLQQINNITKPFKLKSLFLCQTLHIESLILLIQKSGDYLENFESILYDESQQLLLLSILKYCSKIIKYLGSIALNNQCTYLLFDLIKNIKQNLNYLIIDNSHHSVFNYYLAPIILQNLGQILPLKLEYLYLSLSNINTNNLEIFLKNSQNTFIKKFVIQNQKRIENEDIFLYIEEYIMKKKRVKYLAILENSLDLFSLDDKVKEFQLHDIQVLKFPDLVIDIFDYIKEV